MRTATNTDKLAADVGRAAAEVVEAMAPVYAEWKIWVDRINLVNRQMEIAGAAMAEFTAALEAYKDARLA